MQKNFIDSIKPIALILVFCIAFTFFASVGFIFLNAGHYCVDEACKTCEEISNCINSLKKINDYLISITISFFVLAVVRIWSPLLIRYSNQKLKTLVHLKVRLNN